MDWPFVPRDSLRLQGRLPQGIPEPADMWEPALQANALTWVC